jgi:hypothetical protein
MVLGHNYQKYDLVSSNEHFKTYISCVKLMIAQVVSIFFPHISNISFHEYSYAKCILVGFGGNLVMILV